MLLEGCDDGRDVSFVERPRKIDPGYCGTDAPAQLFNLHAHLFCMEALPLMAPAPRL
jgi:hypothetical protein